MQTIYNLGMFFILALLAIAVFVILTGNMSLVNIFMTVFGG